MKRLIVITGGTRGIGKAIAFRFAAAGNFDVVTCSRSALNIKEFTEEFTLKFPHANCHVMQADLEQREEVDKFIHYVHSIQKPVDVLVNNAGVFLPGSILGEEEGVFEKLISLNLSSSYHITRALVKEMVRANKGSVYNICSTASITAYVNGGSYCISKFALLGFSKVLREELKKTSVRVTSVLPGATLTDSWAGAGLPEERFMQPEAIADSILAAYQLPENTVVEELLIRPQLGDIS